MKNDIKFFIVLTIIGTGLAYLTYNNNQKNNKLEKFKQITVGKINRIDYGNKGGSSFVYSFSLKIKCMLEE